MIKVIALDPGICTGYAIGIIEEKEHDPNDVTYDLRVPAQQYHPMKVGSGQEEWKHRNLFNWLYMEKPNILICESFEYRNRARPGLELFSRELIGIVHLYVDQLTTDLRGAIPCTLIMQSPAQAKGYFDDNKLKEEGVYAINRSHANDATRHLLQWYTFGPGYKYNQHGIVAA